jgi:hypothetical protein
MRVRLRAQSLLPLSAVAIFCLASLSANGVSAHALVRRTPLPLSQDTPYLFGRDEGHGDDEHDHMHSHSDETKAQPMPSSHGHSHGHGHGPPKVEINETDILLWHKPTPPSYGTHDFDDLNATNRHPGLMGLHALLMSLAFFVALPIGMWRLRTR